MKLIARFFFTAVLLVNLLPQGFAQPSISYPAGAKVYPTGTAITPLILTNAGTPVVSGAAGAVTTFAGSGLSGASDNAVGTLATFAGPYGIAEDAAGNIYTADFNNNRIRKITPAGAVTTFAGTGTASSIDNAVATLATFNGPTGLVFDASGNLYVTEFTG